MKPVPNTLFDVDLEAGILGSILTEPALIASARRYLKDQSLFYRDSHQQVYQAMLELHAAGNLPEALDVARRLRNNESRLTQIDLLDLTREATLVNFESRCLQLYDLFHRRNVQAVALELIRDLETLSTDALQAGHHFRQHLDRMESGLPDRRAKVLTDVARSVLEEMNQQGRHLIRTGIKPFDEALGGYEPGCLYVPAGRPSMGKSAYLCQQIDGIAVQQKIPIGLLLLEGTDTAIMRRLITRYCGYSVEDIRQGRADASLVSQALDIVGQAPLQIDDSPCTLDRLESRITRLVLNGAQIIFVDYMQRIRDYRPRATAMETITAISGTLKDLAKQLQVPIIALSQLSREPDKRSSWEKRPIMSDLRGSGDLEQDADAIFFLFRPEYYNLSQYPDGISTANLTEVHIAKSRDGAIHTGDDAVVLYHRLKYSAYYSSKGEFDNGEPQHVKMAPVNF
ncbi:replicative DNA helicase [Spirosoma endbachense]|uniref:DNA 5'-3' helicase n=1 Tax=Spirosoma endbachense TaxID=2666025 RepID=A0A6P1W0T0_9BACT|nr:DnaB-like helicase C-terminal domain-containing protein [Spirosoma endbachense]QHV97286.1 hypothetical protein GJR95_20755 [Spirosoma endbachense]